MHIETQTKTNNALNIIKRTCLTSICFVALGCSLVELKPGADKIIFAKQGDDCTLVKTLVAEVKTSTLFIERRPEAIANELQIVAQNEAYTVYANAIWPISDINEGKQSFHILNCKPMSQ